MNKRQKKKHFKKALRLSIISFELAEKYLQWKHLTYYEFNKVSIHANRR